jgi:hypothetical protein
MEWLYFDIRIQCYAGIHSQSITEHKIRHFLEFDHNLRNLGFRA